MHVGEQQKVDDLVFLFVDVDGFTRFHATEQSAISATLRDVVAQTRLAKEVWGESGPRWTPYSEQAAPNLCLPTGDGFCLCIVASSVKADPAILFEFCDGLTWAAVKPMATQHSAPQFSLRIGIAAGPSFLICDFNKNLNIVGGGINTSQRCMSLGDGGHILVHESYVTHLAAIQKFRRDSDPIRPEGTARELYPLGVVTAKHGERFNVWNYLNRDPAHTAGRPELPGRVLQWYVAKNRLYQALDQLRKTVTRRVRSAQRSKKHSNVRVRLLWKDGRKQRFVGSQFVSPRGLPNTAVEFSESQGMVGKAFRMRHAESAIGGPPGSDRDAYERWYCDVAEGDTETLKRMQARPRAIICIPLLFQVGEQHSLRLNGVLSIDTSADCAFLRKDAARTTFLTYLVRPVQEVVWALLAMETRVPTVDIGVQHSAPTPPPRPARAL